MQRKIYALFLESKQTFFLSVQAAWSLEEAFSLAKLEFLKMNPFVRGQNSLEGAKIGLFAIKSIDELNAQTEEVAIEESRIMKDPLGGPMSEMLDFFEREMDGPAKRKGPRFESISPIPIKADLDKNEMKNALMQKIVNNKDAQLFEDNKDMFTKAECDYLKKKLE